MAENYDVQAIINDLKEKEEIKAEQHDGCYELMRWSRVFLMNKSFTTFSGGHNARALLFPMEKVFESYTAAEKGSARFELGCFYSR